MRVEMTIDQAVKFMEQHAEGLECSIDGSDCFFLETYDLKQICAIKALICAVGHLERINPKLLNRSVKYEYELHFGGKHEN